MCVYVCVCVCVCVPVSEPHASSVEVRSERADDPRVIRTILRPCTTGGTIGGIGQGTHEVRGQKDAEKWHNGEEDRRGTAS